MKFEECKNSRKIFHSSLNKNEYYKTIKTKKYIGHKQTGEEGIALIKLNDKDELMQLMNPISDKMLKDENWSILK